MKARRLISPAVRRMEVERFDPGPVPDDGILVRNDFTAVSVGTEIWNWLHGAEPGREPVFPRTTGYCNCGTILAVGSQVTDVQPGERVAGQGNHASHSILRKPYNRVPDDVPSQHAALLTMAAIALHGIRVATSWPSNWCAARDFWWPWVRREERWTSTSCGMSTCGKSAFWAHSIRLRPSRPTSTIPGAKSETGICFCN